MTNNGIDDDEEEEGEGERGVELRPPPVAAARGGRSSSSSSTDDAMMDATSIRDDMPGWWRGTTHRHRHSPPSMAGAACGIGGRSNRKRPSHSAPA
jgi:hypothetical protein